MSESYHPVQLLEGTTPKDDTFSLSSRYVQANPTYQHHEGFPKPHRYPIEKISSIRDQESALIQDLLYVLAGLEGYYIRYTPEFDEHSLVARVRGPDYVINKHIDTSFKDVTKRINRMGKMYFGLSSFVEQYNDVAHGRVLLTLCAEIGELLKEYEGGVLVEIEDEFKHNPRYSLTLLEQRINSDGPVSISVRLQRMYEIALVINEESVKRSNHGVLKQMRFNNIMESLKDDNYTGALDGVTSDPGNSSRYVKGGMILDVIQRSIDEFKGNQRVHQYLVSLFDRVSVRYVEMLNKWLQRGVIDDPQDEFLISEAKVSRKKKNSNYDAVQWADKFTIRREGLLKQFRGRDVQRKVILTGKYLNVLRECTGAELTDETSSSLAISSLLASDLTIKLDECYQRANYHIVQMFFQGYKLDNWMESLTNYFLITDASYFGDFMRWSYKDLTRSIDHASLTDLTRFYKKANVADDHSNNTVQQLVYNLVTPVITHETLLDDLTSILETQTADADEVFAANDIDALRELLQNAIETNTTNVRSQRVVPQTKLDKYTVQRFAIDLEIPFPLSLLITRSQVFEFQLMFRQQLMLRFVDRALEISWREICSQPFWCWNFEYPGVNSWIDQCRALHLKMADFIRILGLYLNYYVVEANWQPLSELFDKKEASNLSLEIVYAGIKTFLSTVMNDSMLTKLKLVQMLHQLFTIMLLFHNLVMAMQKTLVLLDPELFDANHEMFRKVTTYNPEHNGDRIEKMRGNLESYNAAFDRKLTDFVEALQHYGEVDSPSLLILRKELVDAFL